MIEVAGARGSVRDAKGLVLRALAWGAAHGADVQLVDATRVVGAEHLLAAAGKAERSLAEGRNAGATRSLETLLYASGERQITAALKKMGVKDESTEVAAIVWDGAVDPLLRELGLARDDGVLAASEEKLLRFGITAIELSTLPETRWADLVLERVALVDVLKR